MVIPLAPDPKASPVRASGGSINFGMLVPSADGKRADVIETDNGALSITIWSPRCRAKTLFETVADRSAS